MVIPANIPRQQDFSAGQLDERTRRGDDIPLFRAGARQARNYRITNSRALAMRPGRKALFVEEGRTDEVQMETGVTFYLCFGPGTLRIRDSAGLTVAARAGFPWTVTPVSTVRYIVWAKTDSGDIVVCYTNMRPIVIRWDGDAIWTFTEFAFDLGPDLIPRVPFYRMAPRGVTMQPSGRDVGPITVAWSADVITGNDVGSIFRWCGRRIRIDQFTDARHANATVLEKLYPLQRLEIKPPGDTGPPSNSPGSGVEGYAVGQVVIGSESDAEAEIVRIDIIPASDPGTPAGEAWDHHYLIVQLINGHHGFMSKPDDQEPPKPGDIVVGPYERGELIEARTGLGVLPALTWDEQIVSDKWGWPSSCTNDRNRLTLCDLPGLKEAIMWSGIGVPYDFDIDGSPDGAMVEFVSGKPRVYHVLGGADQYVFTDQGVYYIPISEAAPLQTGSVRMRPVAKDGCDRMRPLETTEGHVFLNEGRNRIQAIVGTGQTARPYMVRPLNDYHSDLFNRPIAFATSTGDATYPERYLFVLNDTGEVIVGKYNNEKDWIGWVPWDVGGSASNVKWISSLDARVTFSTQYRFGSTEFPTVVETFDATAWIDGVRLNQIPAALESGQDPDFEHYRTAGVPIGNMSENGTREAAFNSTIQEAAAKCAKRTAADGWVGRFTTVGVTVSKATIYPSSDLGFTDAANVTIAIYGKDSLPSTATDGVLMGTVTVADTTGPVTIIGTHPTTAYKYRWVRVAQTGGTYVLVSEVVFFTQGDLRESSRGATGPLWWMATGTVDVAERFRYIGTRTVDANGNLVLLAEDDLSGDLVYVGEKWTATFEPLFPHAGSGQSVQQTHRRRKIRKIVLALKHTGGFEFCNRRISGWGQGDDETIEPAWRAETLAFRSLGRTVDPRRILTKDTPGPMDILEFSADTTV